MELRGLFRSYSLSTGTGIYLSSVPGILGCQYLEPLIFQPARASLRPNQKAEEVWLRPSSLLPTLSLSFFLAQEGPYTMTRSFGTRVLLQLQTSRLLIITSLSPSITKNGPNRSIRKSNTLYFGSTDHVPCLVLSVFLYLIPTPSRDRYDHCSHFVSESLAPREMKRPARSHTTRMQQCSIPTQVCALQSSQSQQWKLLR